MGHIDEGEQQMAEVMCQIAVSTPGTVEDCMQMLENKLEQHSCKMKMLEAPIPSQIQERSCQLTGVELLTTESSDNGRQADQGEAANIVEATVVTGEAQPVIAAEGGIGGEGATTILASEGQVGEVSAIISEEELGLTGGKFAEED
ncbi:hypothetical protein EDD16DRAFT_1522221 [Pisolithus croceorrhizus]|nr:hypothetical protein EV401DRAFT_1894214 [Pisolithus croceorrhizus]KAI6110450.1 hypothetical protein EDD16DRAFT_1522221 [Pisolithus croceorrhizus]KAI6163922.1 hypothetical protein EDD17DRAFT_1506826 [Pisolithus thermaeus]